MQEAYLGVDVGTTAVKAVLLGRDRVLGETTVAHSLLSPQPGWAEEAPEQWWEGVTVAVRRVLAEAEPVKVAAVGVCSMVPALVLLDDRGEPVRPAILQNDARAAEECQRMGLDPAEVLSRTGSPPSVQQIGPRMRWLWRHEGGAVRRARHLLGGADYVVYRLTGSLAVETNWALESGMWDLVERRWIDRYVEAAQVSPSWLLPVHPPGTVVGTVTAQAAAQTGVGEGTPVLVGSADHVAAALAAGITRPGEVLLKIGGAGDVLAVTGHAHPDPRLFVDYHDVPGLYVVNGCMTTSGSLVRWWASLAHGDAGAPSLAQMDAEAASLAPGSGGLVVLPYFLGEKTPIFDPLARGVAVGLTLSHTRAHLHRAILEAVAYAYRHHVEVLEELGHGAQDVVLSDGGARSPLWRQILADVLGRPVTAYLQVGGSALGVAFLAGMAVGGFSTWDAVGRFRGTPAVAEPQPTHVAVYAEGYRLYRELYSRLREFFPKLYAWAREDGEAG